MDKNRWDINDPKQRKQAWFYCLFKEDHNFINYFRNNLYKIAPKVYRSAQPTMGQLKKYRDKYGIKTIINLKNDNRNSAYFLFEEQRCKQLGLKLINVNVRSRIAPKTRQLIEYKKIMEEMHEPVLIHCKAGVDRTGVFCTLYQYFIEKKHIKDTNQLRFFPYGYIKYSNAGIVNYYFEQFAKYQKKHPKVDLITWSKDIANTQEIEKQFHSNSIANFIYEKILRRE